MALKANHNIFRRGVFTTKLFSKDDFLFEYKGNLIDNYKKACMMEKEYAKADLGCFMYFFWHKGRKMCIDATTDKFNVGRMINDAKKGDALQNCVIMVVDNEDTPHLCIFATRDISVGEELRYDYGAEKLPWRKLLDMTTPELKMIADHMGHNLNIHTDVYRLQSSLLEKTKVARVLIASENGNINKFDGRKLESISIKEIPEPIDFEDSWTAEQITRKQVSNLGNIQIEEEDADDNIMSTDIPIETQDSSENQATRLGKKRKSDIPIETEDSSDDQATTLGKKRKSDTRKMNKIQRVRWTDQENKLFRDMFQEDIANKRMPLGSLVQALSNKLPKRTASQIRTKVHNIITGKLKKY